RNVDLDLLHVVAVARIDAGATREWGTRARAGCILSGARLTTILDVDTERHRQGLLAASRAVRTHAGEAGEVGRSAERLWPANAVTGVAEVAGQPDRRRAGGSAFTTTDQAVEVLGVEAALLLLAGVLPVTLDLIELIEAADAAARRADLP